MRNTILTACVGALLIGGCSDESSTPTAPPAGTTPPAAAAPPSSEAAPTTTAAAEHGRMPLGEKTVGALKLVATQDKPVKAGGEGAFDVVITGGTPKAVRFWVGTEAGAESVKAKAEEETPANWHTHAEVPAPLPPGSQFWVEVEPPTGEKFNASFDLKME